MKRSDVLKKERDMLGYVLQKKINRKKKKVIEDKL